jgi:hypothetical protein
MRTAEEFMIVNVVWFDLFSCISRVGAPRTSYRRWLQPGLVDSARIMGCQNSTMTIIGDIATLEAEAHSVSIGSLRHRLRELEQRALHVLETLESDLEVCLSQILQLPPTKCFPLTVSHPRPFDL